MSEKRIILAHGLNGELGVPTKVRETGLGWPSLPADMHFLNVRTSHREVVIGRATNDICGKWMNTNGRSLHVVSRTPSENPRFHTSLEYAIAAAERADSHREIYIAGGAMIAGAAFNLLEAEGKGIFYETVVEVTCPEANAFMPDFNEDAWTTPEIIGEYPAGFRERRTYSGRVIYEPLPAFRIQVREVKAR